MKIYLISVIIILFCGFNLKAQVPPYIPTLGLVACYTFSANANDISGNGNNGIVNGATLSTDRFGNPNMSYSFIASSYIEVLNNSQFNFQASNQMSLSFWMSAAINTPTTIPHDPISKQTGIGTSQVGWNTFVEDGNGDLGMVVKNGSLGIQGYYSTSNSGLYNNTWHHFVFTFNSGTEKIYIDGVLVQVTTIAAAVVGNNTGNLRIGQADWSSSYNFVGKLDDICIYNRELASCEIYSIYSGTLISMQVVGISNTVCAGASMTMSASGMNTYTWNTSSNSNFIFASPTVNTTYSVSGTNALSGCIINSVIPIFVNPLPVITIGGPNSICIGSIGSLSVSGASTYSWNTTATTTDISVSPVITTTYSVIGTNTNGCVNSASKLVSVNALPTLTIAGVGAICIGNSASLSISGASTYSWSTSSTGSNIVVSPAINATYSAVGTNSNGCSNSASKSVTVNALPILTISGFSAVCIGNTTSLSVIGASTYSWSTNATASVITISPTSNTSYSVVGTDVNTCSNTASASVIVNALPTLIISGSSAICIGNSTGISISGASTYSWNTSSTSTNIIVSPTITATYSVVGTNTNGCSNSAYKSVTVNSLPILTVSGFSAICIGKTASLSVTGASTYSWSTSATTSSITVSPTLNTTYSVIGVDANNCVNSTSVSVIVNALPTLTASGPANICIGSTGNLFVTGANTYSWSTTSTSSNIAVSPATNVTYSVVGMDGNGCFNIASKSITVNALPVLSISAPAAICIGITATLSVTGASTYSWNAGSVASNMTVSPISNTSYSVVGVDANGCVNSASATIIVNPLPIIITSSAREIICSGETTTLTASGAITYTWNSASNGASIIISPAMNITYTVMGTNVNGCVGTANITQNVNLCTGINQSLVNKQPLSVYPNPNTGSFTVRLYSPNDNSMIEMYSAAGQKILFQNIVAEKTDFEINDLPRGLYFLKALGNEKTEVIKMIKE